MKKDEGARALGLSESPRVAALVVTYRPTPETLVHLRAVAPQVDRLIVVDNGSQVR